MESGQVGGSSKHSVKSARSSVHEDEFIEPSKEPSSPSSSSDSSFDEAFFFDDEGEPRKSNVESPHKDAPIELVSSAASSPRIGTPVDSPVLRSLPSSPVHSSQQSPQIQMMERMDVPDPNRIPASIFDRNKSNTPVEWSTQSNESLFSIHMGNASFSKDQLLLMGKSQELGKGDDIFKFPNNSSKLTSFPSPAISEKSDVKTTGIGVGEVAAETMKEVIRENAEDQNNANALPEPRHSTSIPRGSDASGNSTKSFAFPILTKEESKENKSSSVKKQQEPAENSKQQPQTQTPPPPAAKTDQNNWLSCLSCSFCR